MAREAIYKQTRRGAGLLMSSGEIVALRYLHDLLSCLLERGSNLLAAVARLIIVF